MEIELNVDRTVPAFAGLVALTSLVLAWYVSPSWLALMVFAPQRAAGRIHGLLSGGHRLQEARPQGGLRISVGLHVGRG
jgi:hypothetical protein